MTNQSSKPLLMRITGATEYSGFSRSTLYELLKQGKIEARKCGRRTLVSVASLEAYMASLPTYQAGA